MFNNFHALFPVSIIDVNSLSETMRHVINNDSAIYKTDRLQKTE